MGNIFSTRTSKETTTTVIAEVGEKEWPYLCYLTDPELLDWKNECLSDDEIIRISKEQANLPVQISPVLYLSDRKGAHNMERLNELGITHVLNCAGPSARMNDNAYEKAGIVSLNIDADDEEGYPMLSKHLKRCMSFYEVCKKQKGGKIVIHCQAGINRSGVIVAAIHMLDEKKNVLDVVKHIRRQRGNLFLWNESFQKQLIGLAKEKQLLGPLPNNVPTSYQSHVEQSEHESKNKFKASKVKSLFS